MVEATELDAFDGLVASTTGVAVAVVSKYEAISAAGDDGEATDASLQDGKLVSSALDWPKVK